MAAGSGHQQHVNCTDDQFNVNFYKAIKNALFRWESRNERKRSLHCAKLNADMDKDTAVENNLLMLSRISIILRIKCLR